MDSKGDFRGDVGIRSTTGATLHPWISGELHPDCELLEVQILHGEVSPNFSDTSMYILLERRIWTGTEFTFMWPNLRVESLYPPSLQMDPALCPFRKEDSCPFMLWGTLPRDYVRAMTHHTLETGWNIGMVGPEMAYMGEHFNVAFSPRSARLLHASNVSISQVQGTFRLHESDFEAPISVGFRPIWQD